MPLATVWLHVREVAPAVPESVVVPVVIGSVPCQLCWNAAPNTTPVSIWPVRTSSCQSPPRAA